MKKIILIFTLCFMFFSTSLHAARFGSGKSFGQHSSSQRSHNSEKHPQKQQEHQKQQSSQQHNNQPPQKSSFASKFLPLLAGLSIGALLGSLLSGHGLGGALSTILILLLVCGVVFYVVKKLLASKGNNKNIHSFQNVTGQADSGHFASENYSQKQNFSYTPNPSYQFFNKEDFLRTAKTTFIRMQNAYDNKNLTDIRNFTTPEVFAEIQMQIQERVHTVNQTDVIHINGTLINEHEANDISASVLFSGQLREEQNAPPVEINEIWHFVKNPDNNWLISGIEQK